MNKKLRPNMIRLYIKEVLKKNGYTYSQLASTLGVTESTVKRLMAKGDFSLERLETIAEWFGFDLIEFLQKASDYSFKPAQLSVDQDLAFVKRPESLYAMILYTVGFSTQQVQNRLKMDTEEFHELLSYLEKHQLLERREDQSIKILKRGPYESDKNNHFHQHFRPLFANRIKELALRQKDEDMYAIGECYMSKDLFLRMKKQILDIHKEYQRQARLEQDVVDPSESQPICFFLFASQFDMWGELLMNERLRLPNKGDINS